ncbi:MAG: alpha/beta fold hydrolase [Mogibacterium sp.]|nr:alpha/beta fold hydrolase [Mogibacterium sp.]
MDVKIEGLNIKYKISGASGRARTAVVLQGWGTEMNMYDSVSAAIGDRYRVVQLDLPGFGESDEPPEAWSVDDYCDFFCKFMGEIKVKKAVLIGHSYGGRMIIKMASRSSEGELPFEISKIMLIDSAGIMPERTAMQNLKVKRYKMMRKFLTSAPVHALFPEVIDYWLSKQGSEDYKRASAVMKACLVKAVNEDLRGILPSVKQETLLVWGSEDLDTPISDAHIMESLMPNAALVTLEGAGHYSFLEQPLMFRSIIRSFLEADKVAKGGRKTAGAKDSAAKKDSKGKEDSAKKSPKGKGRSGRKTAGAKDDSAKKGGEKK